MPLSAHYLIWEMRVEVMSLEFLPLGWVVAELRAQGRARRDVPEPQIDPALLLRHTPRPQTIDQHAVAVGPLRLVVSPLDLNSHVSSPQSLKRGWKNQPHLP